MKDKKNLIWIGIALAVVIGIGIYIWLSRDISPAANVGSGSGVIPAPPALPN